MVWRPTATIHAISYQHDGYNAFLDSAICSSKQKSTAGINLLRTRYSVNIYPLPFVEHGFQHGNPWNHDEDTPSEAISYQHDGFHDFLDSDRYLLKQKKSLQESTSGVSTWWDVNSNIPAAIIPYGYDMMVVRRQQNLEGTKQAFCLRHLLWCKIP